MQKKAKKIYNIVEKDIIKHAPFVYNCIQEHYNRLVRTGLFVGDKFLVINVITKSANEYGIQPAKTQRSYSIELLKNDKFKIAVP
jgi:hypothetical protein